jgi:hypothetical protein
MRFGETYFVPLASGVNWELVAQNFLGETVSLSPSQMIPQQKQAQVIKASQERDRLRFDTLPPW